MRYHDFQIAVIRSLLFGVAFNDKRAASVLEGNFTTTADG